MIIASPADRDDAPRGRNHAATAGASRPTALIRPLLAVQDLQNLPRDTGTLLVEVDEDMGTYFAGHVPGAVGLNWLEELQHPQQRGFVDAERFAAVMNSHGISNDTHVVLLGDADNRYAALVYWYFAYYGHRRLSLLDGGRRAWLAAGHPLSEDDPPARRSSSNYEPGPPRHELRATREQVLAEFVGSPPGRLLLDCRTPAEHAGHLANVLDLPLERHRLTGHIPGSRNLPSGDLLDPDNGHFLPVEQLRALLADRGVAPGVQVALYCRIADRSSVMWFALHELVGHPQVRLYDGGWAEYGSLIDAPVTCPTS